MQNAVKHLSPVKGEDEGVAKDEELHILSDFSARMYGYEDRAEFQEAFDNFRSKVACDPFSQTISCSCGIFNRIGTLCAHGLKVLDLMNVKILLTHYVLKKWTREARNGSILDRQGRKAVENPKLEAQLRYKFLSHKFHNVAYKAASSTECCLLLDNALDCLGTQLGPRKC
jgi:hypothetical protein